MAPSGDERMVGLCDVEVLPKFREAVRRVADVHDIHAIGAAVSMMCDIVLEKLQEEEHQEEPGARERSSGERQGD